MRTIAGASAGRLAVARAPLSRPVQGRAHPRFHRTHADSAGLARGGRARHRASATRLPLEFRSTWACSRTRRSARHQGEGQRAYAEAEAVRGLDGLHEAPFSGDAGAHARTGGRRHGEGGARGDGAQVPRASDRQERRFGRDRRGAREAGAGGPREAAPGGGGPPRRRPRNREKSPRRKPPRKPPRPPRSPPRLARRPGTT